MSGKYENLIERLYEDVWNEGNLDTADELVHDDYTIHDRDLAAELDGPEFYKALATGTRVVFPDAEFTIEDIFVSGQKVAVRWEMTGTHKGEMLGIEPTGVEATLSAIEINRFEDEKLIETWTQSDELGLMEQLNSLGAK
ncbi:ester cyclase (plasmid) [Haloferax sp. S1W]|uniref:ester cyclase n=1 Tax=Haloferax sp. S1W TaxID=3377110 RepID=UPI0037C738D4